MTLRAVLPIWLGAAVAVFVVGVAIVPALAQQQEIDVEFTEEYLNDPENIAAGEAIWKDQCRLCHGRGTGYPGKAPKLNPKRYSPEFVYHRVTYGFRGMPAWQDAYDKEERKAIVAYVLSNDFAD